MKKIIIFIPFLFFASGVFAETDCSQCICKEACRAKLVDSGQVNNQTADVVQHNPIEQPETPDQPPAAVSPDYPNAPEPPPQVPTIEEWLCQKYGICD